MAKSKVSKAAEEAKTRLSKVKAIIPPDYENALSTGSCLLNMAFTGHPNAGFLRGTYYYLVGDTNSGKSFASLCALAEAANSDNYNDYRLILDNVEGGVQMNVARMFGRKLADRLEPPRVVNNQARHSEQVEEFYLNLDEALSKGSCIYVLDSMDGLSSMDEEKKFEELKKVKRGKASEDGNGEEIKGSYTDGKAKKNSAFLRQMLGPLQHTQSILIIISQTRDNMGFGFEKRTRSGGRAPSFYAQVEAWSSVKQKLNRRVRQVERHVGNLCEFHVKRSRFTGHEAKVRLPIYFSAGIDDLGSCIDYLIQEEHWEGNLKGTSVAAPEFQHDGRKEALIKLIEDEGKERELHSLVAQVWCEIESESAVERKPKYK